MFIVVPTFCDPETEVDHVLVVSLTPEEANRLLDWRQQLVAQDGPYGAAMFRYHWPDVHAYDGGCPLYYEAREALLADRLLQWSTPPAAWCPLAYKDEEWNEWRAVSSWANVLESAVTFRCRVRFPSELDDTDENESENLVDSFAIEWQYIEKIAERCTS